MTWTPPNAHTQEVDALVDRLRLIVASALHGTASGEDRLARLEEIVQSSLRQEQLRRTHTGQPPLDRATEREVSRRLRLAQSPLGPMAYLLTPDSWSDVEVNGAANAICTDRSGRRIQIASPFRSEDEAFSWVAAQAAAHGRRFDDAAPSVRCRLAGGIRLHAIAQVTGRVHISCRLSDPGLDSLPGLESVGMFDADLTAVLTATAWMQDPFGLVISGATTAGKTTLLRACLNAHPANVVLDRIVTVEDEMELFLDPNRFPNLVAFEAREANVEGEGAYTMERFLSADLRRLTPDRVALGELRPDGGVMPLLLALGQGVARGVAATIHAPSAADVIPRIRTYAAFGEHRVADSVVLDTIAASVDLIVQVSRIGGRRVISSVLEVAGRGERGVSIAELWRWNPSAGRATRTDLVASDELTARMTGAGLDVNILDRNRSYLIGIRR
ncbi:ATPase, T2SS/T4P/T4SS family [Frankia sp. R82]|uniref:ATPase, T2SS/T4P/T4SS family n=1 Tax=Frankia sp. R82 TaxID=2950553 RepID=UPI0020435FB1|nr:ATPase, T2SS/T4P/T4SS family [Frankia sp. R82]MCM3883553.1 Flp pilus assembly complex ATPase component TadA [Frankia sp. R82]